jgi:hypothetical protein
MASISENKLLYSSLWFYYEPSQDIRKIVGVRCNLTSFNGERLELISETIDRAEGPNTGYS